MMEAPENQHIESICQRSFRLAPAGLIIDGGNRVFGRVLARQLRAAIADVETGVSVAQAAKEGLFANSGILLVNYDALSSEERRELLALIEEEVICGHVLILSSGLPSKELATLLFDHRLTNFLRTTNELPELDELLVTIHKLVTKDLFGLDKYFPWGCPVTSLQAYNRAEALEAVQFAKSFAKRLVAAQRLGDAFEVATYELVTNALYNGPCDAQGRPLYAHLARNEDVSLSKDEPIEIRLCGDGRRIGVSITDVFGTLSSNRVLDYLGKCLRQGRDQIDVKPGGAGLGLYYSYSSVSHLAVNLAPQKRTEMIGLIDVRGSYKEFVSRGKSFNIFKAEVG